MANDDDLIRRGDAMAAVHEADSLELAQHGESRIAERIAALPPVTVSVKPPFYFDRYINGVRMAEDVCVERETTLESAMLVAARIASKGANGEAPVLVYRAPVTPARLTEDQIRQLVEEAPMRREERVARWQADPQIDALMREPPAPDAAAIREAVADLADFLDAQHKSHMTGLGRNPADYMSGYSVARDMARDILITEKPHDRA